MIKINFEISKENNIIRYQNRGMSLEQEINESNEYYLNNEIAIIYKKPTPINIVKCQENKISEAYFEAKSTTDYNGVYQGLYIDFEAKSTQSKTSFPLKNIQNNQFLHAKRIFKALGVSFFIIEFSKLNRYFILPTKLLLYFIKVNKSSSIPLSFFIKECIEINRKINPPLDYISLIKDHLDLFLM